MGVCQLGASSAPPPPSPPPSPPTSPAASPTASPAASPAPAPLVDASPVGALDPQLAAALERAGLGPSSLPFDAACRELALDRPAFLRSLRDRHGVTSLAARQALANALGAARRAGRVPGVRPPRVAGTLPDTCTFCTYGGVQQQQQQQEQEQEQQQQEEEEKKEEGHLCDPLPLATTTTTTTR